jgi:hypothetical protein
MKDGSYSGGVGGVRAVAGLRRELGRCGVSGGSIT